MVDVEFVEQFPRLVPLDRIKQTKGLQDMVLVKRSRLSVQPVTPEQFAIVERLGKA
jgi:predicted RNA-binding protein with PUA-like domain